MVSAAVLLDSCRMGWLRRNRLERIHSIRCRFIGVAPFPLLFLFNWDRQLNSKLLEQELFCLRFLSAELPFPEGMAEPGLLHLSERTSICFRKCSWSRVGKRPVVDEFYLSPESMKGASAGRIACAACWNGKSSIQWDLSFGLAFDPCSKKEGRPIAYYNEKLSESKLNYSTDDVEFDAVVQTLRHWRTCIPSSVSRLI